MCSLSPNWGFLIQLRLILHRLPGVRIVMPHLKVLGCRTSNNVLNP